MNDDMDIGLLGRIIGNPLGIDSLVAVFPAVPETEVVIKDCLNEAIEAQPSHRPWNMAKDILSFQ